MDASMNLRNPMVFLGETTYSISGNKLPTNKQVLNLLFHYTRETKKTLAESFRLVINEAFKFWSMAGIPVQYNARCVGKLGKLYNNYRSAQRKSNAEFEQEFLDYLDKLFDIAHGDVQHKADSNVLKFLDDRKTVRKYHLHIYKRDKDSSRTVENIIFEADEDITLVQSVNEDEINVNDVNSTITDDRSTSDLTLPPSSKSTISDHILSGETTSTSQRSISSIFELQGRNYEPKKERGTINILTEDVVATLDRCRISYRNSVRVISSIATALGVDTNDLILNKTSFNEYRSKIRKDAAEKMKMRFGDIDVGAAVTHWDGK